MPRKPIVSRTLKGTYVMFKAADRTNDVMLDLIMELPRTYKDEKSLMKAGQAELSNPDIVILKVVEQKPKTFNVKMDERDFFRSGTKTEILN